MKFYSKFGVMLLTCVLLFSSGCSEQSVKTAEYGSDYKAVIAENGSAFENERFTLVWNQLQCSLTLTDKLNGDSWSTSLDISGDGQVQAGQIAAASPLNVEYIDPEDLSVKTVQGYAAAVKNGKISSEIIDDGIKVTYYFENIRVSVPVVYRLREESLSVSIDTSEITEEQYKIYRIIVAPFFCSVKNGSADSYIFVPSGSGALINTEDTGNGTRNFSEEVYGDEKARKIIEQPTNTESVHIPVFGVKYGTKALCGIIEKGAESAVIEAAAGSSQTGLSNVYAAFMLRGYDWVENEKTGVVAKEFAVNFDRERTYTVAYYPLSGADADYVGMAKLYREYLFGNDAPSAEDRALSVKILGGIETRAFFLGIPYKKLSSMTSFGQALEVLEDIREHTDSGLSVCLYGFGTSGINVGKVAGEFRFGSVFGSQKEYDKLTEYCQAQNISLYTDFDLMNYDSSGAGFSGIFDAAKTANREASNQYYRSKALGNADTSFGRYKLLKREKLFAASNKMIAAADELNVTGISLSSLSATAYSDYSDSKYYVKGHIQEDVTEILADCSDSGLKTAVGAANSYAAASADEIFDVPLGSSKYDCFCADVPFYSAVFKGYVPITAASVNLGADPETNILKAVESGAGLSFTVFSDYITAASDAPYAALYASVYENNRDWILCQTERCEAYYKAVGGAKIIGNSDYAPGIRKTEFDNGIIVYVNYSEQDTDTPAGRAAAGDFVFMKEG